MRSSLGQEEGRNKEKTLIPGEHELVRNGFKSKVMIFMNIMSLGLMIPASGPFLLSNGS